MINTKICTKCKEKKSVDLFYKRSDQTDKYTSACKSCKRSHDNAHYAKTETKQKKAEYAKNLRTNKEFLEKEKKYKYEYNRKTEVKNCKKLKQQERRKNLEVVLKERMRGLEYAKKHPEKFAMKTRTRKASKLKRTPQWLNNGHLFEIECIYKYCSSLRMIGLKYEVDHIVPLQGKTVSGLHVPWNLQVILGKENASKGNRIW